MPAVTRHTDSGLDLLPHALLSSSRCWEGFQTPVMTDQDDGCPATEVHPEGTTPGTRCTGGCRLQHHCQYPGKGRRNL